MLVHWLWLATRPNMSDREKFGLLQHFQDAEDVYFADDFAGLPETVRQSLQDKDLKEAEGILAACAEKDIRICTIQDAAYPAKLKNIADPPLVLYYKGNLPEFDAVPTIALVGTRKSSAYGYNVARRMGYQITQCGALLISGMADGIDGAGAIGGLTAGGNVVGVLGCGVDVVYPAKHKALYADVQQRGCLISEFPPGTPPYKWNFPKRNRILSGLGNGVLVVEAPERSGSLITARNALEQGRDVFVVPGNIDMPTFAGSNALLRQGATMVTCGWDVVSEYAALYPGKVHQSLAQQEKELPKVAQKPLSPEKHPVSDSKKEKKPIDNSPAQPYSVIRDDLSEEAKKILAVLEKGECHADEVAAQCGLTAAQVSGAVTILQIKGIVEKKPGNILKFRNGAYKWQNHPIL